MIWLVFLLAQNLATDPSLVSRGEVTFAQYCSVGYCHGIAGSAGKGPRLRQHRLSRSYVHQVTRDGITHSGMPGWKGRLREQDISAVVAYVMSLASVSESASPPLTMPEGVGLASLANFTGPLEAKPGHDLFFDATRGTRCGTCHSASQRGIPIGPNLENLTTIKDRTELLSLIQSEQSKHVLTARLKSGDVFPVLRAEQGDKWVKLYDLSSPLPVLLTLERKAIESLVQTGDWAHESVVRSYDEQELEVIVLYLEWLSSPEK